MPAGIQHWDGRHPAPHPCLTVLQASEPSTLHLPVPPTGPIPPTPAVRTENFGLLSSARTAPLATRGCRRSPTPNPLRRAGNRSRRRPRPPGRRRTKAKATAKASALAVVREADPRPRRPTATGSRRRSSSAYASCGSTAAGEPAGSALPEPTEAAGPCCCECGKVHLPHVDEYYFWLAKARYFDTPPSNRPTSRTPTACRDGRTRRRSRRSSDWESGPMIAHLHWCRVHNGEFGESEPLQGWGLARPGAARHPRAADARAPRAGCGFAGVRRRRRGSSPASKATAGRVAPSYPGWEGATGWRYALPTTNGAATAPSHPDPSSPRSPRGRRATAVGAWPRTRSSSTATAARR